MQSMRTRAARLHGTLCVHSDAGGTRVELVCPLEAGLAEAPAAANGTTQLQAGSA